MMVQIVEHRAATSVDFVVEEEAASFTPQVPNRPMLGTAAVHAARQHTTHRHLGLCRGRLREHCQ
jgi:hypothetical protein